MNKDCAKGQERTSFIPVMPERRIHELLPRAETKGAFRAQMATILYGDTKIPGNAFADERLLEMLSQSDTRMEDLFERLKLDPVLSLKIMRLARMSIYQRGAEVESLEDAHQRLGLREIRNLIYAERVCESFRGFNASVDWRAFWHQSLLRARLCEKIITLVLGPKNFGFINGLLNDTGTLILREYFPEATLAIEDLYRDWYNLPAAEEKVLGFHHAHIAGILCFKWRFPVYSSYGVYYHHTIDSLPNDPRIRIYAHAGLLADRLVSATLDLNDGLAYANEAVMKRSPEWRFINELLAGDVELDLDCKKESQIAKDLARQLLYQDPLVR